MSTYASGTKVSIDRSIGEIRQTLNRFGATGFGFLQEENVAVIAFKKEGRHIRFVLHLPERSEFRLTETRGIKRTPAAVEKEWSQAVAERWRALALAIKSKVVSIDSGIETFEQAFLAHVVVPGSDKTVSELLAGQIEDAYQGRATRPLMLAAPTPAPKADIVRTTRISEVQFDDER